MDKATKGFVIGACGVAIALICPARVIAANAAVDPKTHELCSQAKDYVGCVKAMTGASSTADPNDPLVALRGAMKQVASRLNTGTSLRDSTLTFQPVTDAHAVVPISQQNTLAYQAATLAIDLWNRTRKNWRFRIENTSSYDDTTYLSERTCEFIGKQVASFNNRLGKQVIEFRYKTRGLLRVCYLQTEQPETLMYRYTVGVLREGATNPQLIADYKAKRLVAIRLANLGPWQRHLEKNPGLKAWAAANPEAAKREQEKFNRKNGSDPVVMPALPDSMPYLQGTVVEDYLGK